MLPHVVEPITNAMHIYHGDEDRHHIHLKKKRQLEEAAREHMIDKIAKQDGSIDRLPKRFVPTVSGTPVFVSREGDGHLPIISKLHHNHALPDSPADERGATQHRLGVEARIDARD